MEINNRYNEVKVIIYLKINQLVFDLGKKK